MKIIFRVNFHSISGQSLWLKLAILLNDSGSYVEQILPLRWLNHDQWQTEIDLYGNAAVRLNYSYQLRQEHNDVERDEWDGPRTAIADPPNCDTLLLRDTWCIAGSLDYALATKAFRSVLPERGNFSVPPISVDENHRFQLRMAAVPMGLVPCIIGGVRELGDWGWHHALPMHEVAANCWEASTRLPGDWWIDYKYGLYDPKLACAVALEIGDNRKLEPRGISAKQLTIIRDEGYRRDPSQLYRAAGVAVPVFSLRSSQSLGIGEFADLKPLADWAKTTGLKLIQILPINDTTSAHDWTDSYPYSAISVFALHPIYLRVTDLKYPMPADFSVELAAARAELNALDQVDYEQVIALKTKLTRQIFKKHHAKILRENGYLEFLAENREWLLPYAVFCVKRDEFGTADFSRWGDWAVFDASKCAALTEPANPQSLDVSYHIWLQYELDLQLTDAVRHLSQHGISLKGDLPIGIDRQSVDAWAAPHLFKMDAQAGAPPDAFAIKGQNWGFPTYDWETMRVDGYAWWRSRFVQLSRYFDAYRIDHILGFFRIWQIPTDQVEGIMGWFDPALPLHIDEIRSSGVPFDFNRYCRPYIHASSLDRRFGDFVNDALTHYLEEASPDHYRLRDHVSTQRGIVDHFATWEITDFSTRERMNRLREALLDCASEVLFFEVPGSQGTLFHPRCLMHLTESFQALEHDLKSRLEDLYNDYFYRRQDGFWEARGWEKLPVMRRASTMLLCGEDLGMVPDCVPGVMRELGILSLEIQRMPKSSKVEFADPSQAPYLSVVSPSTHDMPTLRAWWREDARATANFAWKMLGISFPPLELTTELATRIIRQHLDSPAMWAIFPLQDLLAIDETLCHPDPDAERINVPAITPYYWRYRMHLGIEQLAANDEFNSRLKSLIGQSRR